MTATTKALAIISLLTAVSEIETAAQVRALDYETPAFLDFELGEVSTSEDQTTLVLNLHRTGDFRQFTRVDFVTEENSASEGQDYKGAGGTITFQPGEGVKQITLSILPDDQFEPDEDFRVRLKNPGPNTTLMRDAVLVKIAEPLPQLEITAAPEGGIALKWDSAGAFLVEKSADGDRWDLLKCTPAVKGTEHSVTEPCTGGILFYRLKAAGQ